MGKVLDVTGRLAERQHRAERDAFGRRNAAATHARKVLERKQDIIDAVNDFWVRHDCGPTRPQLRELTGLGREALQRHVADLIEDGVLEQVKVGKQTQLRVVSAPL